MKNAYDLSDIAFTKKVRFDIIKAHIFDINQV